ncbi:MAG: DUF1592 domain-containing protein, partial [Planctomycetota bacterium]
ISRAKTPVSLSGQALIAVSLVVGGGSWLAGRASLADDASDSSEPAEVSSSRAEAEAYFREHVSPFIKTYCLDCHSNRRPTEAGVNFSPALEAPGHAAFSEQWKNAVARVRAHDMPPDDTGEIPSDQERQDFIDWLTRIKFLSDKDPGVFVIRRLTKTEYGNTLRDLLGVNPQGVQELPDEVSGEGYLNSLSPLQLEHYLSIADRVLDQFFASDDVTDPEWKQQLFGEAPASASAARVAAGRIARSFCRKAYRRPPSEAEIGVMLDVFELGRQKDLDHRGAIRLMLKSALVSPQFLFITPAEVADPDAEIVPLDDHQLASRLSYFLWATMPDDELMSLADRGQLHEPHVLKAQAKRLLDDPRSGALFDGFATQWLGLGGWQDKVFDPSKFPQMTVELRASMHDEARLFFESVVREDRSVETFVDSDYTFLNESLAAVYGLQGTISGPAMRKVHLSDPNRGGVLGMPSVLAATSFPDRTSPVKRGVWVLEQLLGDHVPPAPPDVPALDEQDQQTADELTVRERIELHRQNPVCANCHRTLDPIGFGLENFDAIGRWRLKDDNGEWIDASGELPGGIDFSSPHELKSIVAGEVDKVSRNLYEKLLAYALCRKLEGYDEFVVEESMREIANGGYRMQTLITAVITSYPFTHRRIREALDPQ